MIHSRQPLNLLRLLLFVFAWLFALRPVETFASIPRQIFTATPLPIATTLAANSLLDNGSVSLSLGFDDLYNGGVLVRQNPWSKFDPEGLETFDNGTDVTRKGQHVSPVETWKDPKGNVRFSKDVTDQLNEVRINPENGQKVRHGWSKAHETYSDRAEAITASYVEKAKKAGLNPGGLSGKEANAFANGLVKELQNDKYINRFNEMVRMGKGAATELNAMRDAALAEGILKETGFLARAGEAARGVGKVFKWAGRIAKPLMIGAAAVDAAENGPEVATKNFVKSVSFYDVTVEPAGKGTMKAMDGLIHIGGPDTGRNQMERMLREDE